MITIEYLLKRRNIVNINILLFFNVIEIMEFFIFNLIAKVSFIFYTWRFSPVIC